MTYRRRISATERMAIWQREGGVCHICGQKIDGSRERWDIEHVIPLAMGGDEARGSLNLKPAHVRCHTAKTREDKKQIAKAKRMQQREAGIPRQSSRPIPGGRKSKWKRKLNGEVVPR